MTCASRKNSLVLLLSSAGRRVELLNCFRQDAAELGLELRVLGVDANPGMSSACALADVSFQVPRCTTPEFISRLLEICAGERVDLLVPTIDTELEALACHRDQFGAIGTEVVISSAEVVRLARNKQSTAQRLREDGIPVPQTVGTAELARDPKLLSWPVVIKPLAGSSSIGIRVVNAPSELKLRELEGGEYIAQELLRGREYTVNLFFDRAGKLRATIPHRRCEVRAGEVSKGVTERQPLLLELAQRMEGVLKGAYGPLCYQAIVDEAGQAAVFEINARFGGGFPLAHRAGAKFSKWLLESAAGLPESNHSEWKENVLMLRYDAAVFRENAY